MGRIGRKRRGPWQRSSDGCWYTTIGRKNVKLGGPDEPWEAIETAYHRVHAKGQKPANLTVSWLCDEFLEFCQHNRSAATYDWYADFLRPFVAHVGLKLRVDNLTPAIVSRWVSRQSPGSQHSAARAVVRVMNWSVAERLIQHSPLVGYVKPQPGRREVAITPAQYAKCLDHAKGRFRDALIFLWHTGCRPQELRIIEARWIDGHKIVLPAAQSKGKKRRRVIYLDDTAAEIAERLSAEFSDGPIFRSMFGKPWAKCGLTCAFRRLRAKTGIDGLCAYAVRHGFATEALKNGLDTTTVGVLMGHANPSMVAKVYQHLAQDDSYMLGAMAKLHVASGAASDSPQSAAG